MMKSTTKILILFVGLFLSTMLYAQNIPSASLALKLQKPPISNVRNYMKKHGFKKVSEEAVYYNGMVQPSNFIGFFTKYAKGDVVIYIKSDESDVTIIVKSDASLNMWIMELKRAGYQLEVNTGARARVWEFSKPGKKTIEIMLGGGVFDDGYQIYYSTY